MANDYTLLIKAQVDVSEIQSQLNALAGQYKINIGTQINTTGLQGVQQQVQQVQQQLASTAKQNPIIDPTVNAQILKDIDQQAKMVGESTGKNLSKTITNQQYADGVLKSATIQKTFTDELGRTVTETYKYTAATDQANSKLTLMNRTVDDAAKRTKVLGQTFLSEMGKMIQNTVKMALSFGLVYGAFRQLQDAIVYIQDLNKSLTDTQIVTGMTDEQINQLATDSNRLAQQMGATTQQVTQGALEWFRQGKTAQEALQLTQSSLMLSKLGNIEAAQATEYLTSTLNGYKLAASDANSVIDKMIAIDNTAATSSAELATALQYSAASAQQTGVSLEELLSYIGTISSVTRTSAETIGQALKTMFANMENVKAGATVDGVALNNVEKSLKRVGIALREEDGSAFRPMGDVLADIAEKWSSLDTIQQAELASTIGGKRQRTQFLVLMTNWNEVLREQAAETNSAGLATSRYQIYLESVAASADRMKAAWEGVWQKTINSGGIKFFYDLSAAIGNAVGAMGGLTPIVIAVIANILLINGAGVIQAFNALRVHITESIANFVAMGTAAEATGIATTTAIGGIGLALAAGLIAWNLYKTVVKSTDEQLQQLSTDIQKLTSDLTNLQSQQNKLSSLWNDYQKLSKAASASTEDQQRLRDIQNEIKQILPEVSGEYDNQGNFILDESVNLGMLIKLQQQKIDLDQKELDLKHGDRLKLEAKSYMDAAKELKKLIDLQKLQQSSPNPNSVGGHVISDDEIAKQKQSVDSIINELEQLYVTADAAEKIRIIDWLNSLGDEGQAAAKQILEFVSANQKIPPVVGEAGDAVEQFSDEFKKAYDEIFQATVALIRQETQDKIDALQKELDALNDTNEQEKESNKEVYEAKKKELDDLKKQLDQQYEDEKRRRDDKKRAIQDELDGYEQIIDAEEKLLEAKKKEQDYENDRADKQKKLADLEAQIAAVSLDTSAEGIAKRKELESQAAALKKELDKNAADHEYDLQQQALEAEKKKAQQEAEARIKALEDAQRQADLEHELEQRKLEDKIKALEDGYNAEQQSLEQSNKAQKDALQQQIEDLRQYLSEQGTINNDARQRLAEDNGTLYQQLIDWNEKYGTGLDNDITKNWDTAKVSLKAYIDSLQEAITAQETLNDVTSGGTSDYGMGYTPDGDQLHAHHSGLDTGFVGGKAKLKSNEEFAKLLKGEIVVNPGQMDNFMRRILPSIPSVSNSGASGGNVLFDHLIEVQGNMTENVVPEMEKALEKAIQKLTDAMKSRGMIRQANAFSI